MSSEIFERLLYTDCRPGEGMGGGGGFQIQAQSSGTTSAQARMATGWLLYSAQHRWVNDGRDLADFPLGLAHAADAGFGTAQSRYLGKEVNGNRQGNHLADCLLSVQAEPYGVIRPAQLWLAPFWRAEAWPSTTCPAFDEGLDIGPFDHDEIAGWLRGMPQRRAGLEGLLTVLDDPSGPRVIIKANDPEAALFWVAAATILMPQSAALSISFRVFANNVDDSPHRIIGVPSELYPYLSPGNRPRTFIIDATTDQTDVVEASARARYWVTQFIEAEEPYDVVEAVELAAQFGGANEEEQRDARVAAMALADPDRPVDDAVALGRWVRRALGSAHAQRAQSVVARLIAADEVRIDDLRMLDSLAAEGRITANTTELRSRLLHEEIAQANAGLAPPRETLPPVSLSRTQSVDANSAVVSAMVLGSNGAVDQLLRVARRHSLDLKPNSSALITRLHSFVEHLLATPGDRFELDAWAAGDVIIDQLHEQLRSVFLAGNRRALADVLPQVAAPLVHRGLDATDPFSWEIEGCYMAGLPPTERIIRSRQTIQALLRYGDLQFRAYQAGLMSWHAVDPETALHVVSSIPPTFELDPALLAVAERELMRRAQKPDEKTVMVIEALRKRHALPDDPRLWRIARSAEAMYRLLVRLERLQPGSDLKTLSDDLHAMRDADPDVVELSIPAFVHEAHRAQGAVLGQSILRFLPAPLGVLFARKWSEYLRDVRRSPRAAARSVTWLTDKHISSQARTELVGEIQAHLASLDEPDAAAWRTSVANFLRDEGERSVWQEVCGEEPAGSRRRGRLWGKGEPCRTKRLK